MKAKLQLLRAALATTLKHSGVSLGGCIVLALVLADTRTFALEGATGVHDPSTVGIAPGNGVALEPFTGDDAQRWVITTP